MIKIEENGLVCLGGGRMGGVARDKDGREWTGLSGGKEGGGGELYVIKMEGSGLVCLEGRKVEGGWSCT